MNPQTPRRDRLGGPSGQRGFGLVEAMVALVVFTIGALTLAGISLRVGQLHAQSSVQTDQTYVADQLFGTLREVDFDAVASGTRTMQIGSHAYSVDVDVTPLSADTKRVVATVSGAAFAPDTFRTVVRRTGAYPTSP